MKFPGIQTVPGPTHVAPLAGAWIEIKLAIVASEKTSSSLPLRERGLKYPLTSVTTAPAESLPLRERGLKSINGLGLIIGLKSLPLRERGLKSSERAVSRFS